MEMVGIAGAAGGGEVEPIVGCRNLGYGVFEVRSRGNLEVGRISLHIL